MEVYLWAPSASPFSTTGDVEAVAGPCVGEATPLGLAHVAGGDITTHVAASLA